MSNQDITAPIVLFGSYVKRASTTFGVNSNPTTLELDLVSGTPGNAIDTTYGASGINVTGLRPGTLSRFTMGALDFAGIIQSWNYNYGPDGFTYSVKATDPRVAFGNIPILLEGFGLPTGIRLWNYLNPFQYYGSPSAADSNEYGMTFSKIKNYLETTGIINLYGNQFRLQFSSGFNDISGAIVSHSGVPVWYRLNSGQTTLEQFISQTANDMGFDWYAHIEVSSYLPTGVNTIKIRDIPRIVNSGTDIDNFITQCQFSGTLISYQRGQELRSDAISCVLHGAKKTFWQGFNNTEMSHFWGFDENGAAMTTPYNSSSGIVILDGITGPGSTGLWPFTIQIPTTVVGRSSAPNVYPPTISYVSTTVTHTGYCPTHNEMRAALFNQKSWETALYADHSGLAISIGIGASPFLGMNTFLNRPESIQSLAVVGRGVSDRTEIQKALIGMVYESTRSVAEQHWGRTWMVNLPTSTWYNNVAYEASELFPRIEYSLAAAAWSESSVGMPSGVSNHEFLNTCNHQNFKDDKGCLKPFCSFTNYDSNYDSSDGYPNGFPYIIDTRQMNRNEIMFDQGPKLCLPISVTAYELDPTKAIVTMPVAIEALRSQAKYENRAAYYDFLKFMYYSDAVITSGNLMLITEDQVEFGLAPPRLIKMLSAPGNFGIHVPLQSNTEPFQAFYVTGSVAGPLNIISDDSMAPWTYGSYAQFQQAAQALVSQSTSLINVVDYGNLRVAGLPMFNIGDNIGVNATIGSISMQLGVDGLTTNYSLKIVPTLGGANKLLNEKITRYYHDIQKNIREVREIRVSNEEELLNSPSRINPWSSKDIWARQVAGKKDGSSSKKLGSKVSFSTIAGNTYYGVQF